MIYVQVSISKPGCMEVMCSMEQCLIDPLVLSELEKGSESGNHFFVLTKVLWNRKTNF